MKQNLKKMLLALMMGIGIVGAVSVQSQEKEWVRSGDYSAHYIPIGPLLTIVPLGTAATLDGICQDIAIPRFAPKGRYDEEYYIYIYGGKRTSTGAQWITCYYTDVETNRQSNVGVYFTCNGDMIDLDRPDGCYEEKDKCTADEIRNPETGECVVPCTGIGEDGTASPKGCVPVNAEECDEKWEGRTNSVGFVSCNGENGENRSVCVFDDPFFTDPEAAKFNRECTYVHEFTHIITEETYGGSCIDDMKQPDDQGTLGASLAYLSEHEAYTASTTCLLEKQRDCGANETCVNQLAIATAIYSERAAEMYRCGTVGGADCK